MDNKLKETYMKTHYAGEILDELYDKDIVEAKEIIGKKKDTATNRTTSVYQIIKEDENGNII